MRKIILISLLLISMVLLSAISYDDAEFCLQKELWPMLDKHAETIADSAFALPSAKQWLELYTGYAEQKSDTLAVLTCLEKQALEHRELDKAVNWVILSADYGLAHPEFPLIEKTYLLKNHFPSEPDSLVLSYYIYGAEEDSLYNSISRLTTYNSYIEDLAKALLDMISIERDDSVAVVLTDKFKSTFPHSKWDQAIYYFDLARAVRNKDYTEFENLIDAKIDGYEHKNSDIGKQFSAYGYIASMFLTSPTLRREKADKGIKTDYLDRASKLMELLPQTSESITILYDNYLPAQWQARLQLQRAKVVYYRILENNSLLGDEKSLVAISKKPMQKAQSKQMRALLDSIAFPNNDAGELAELSFWKGKYHALFSDRKNLETAARHFTQCLIHGAPRKKYDTEALQYLELIRSKLKINSDLMTWQRELMKYNGIIFADITEEAGLMGRRESRVALGDYDNDGFCDILLNGRRLYKNNGDITFTDVSDSLGLSHLNSNGGLFADFNLDGRLDFMTISHGEEGNGERLMKNMGYAFAPVNDRAGEIDDKFPTEGAAWIDCSADAYPDLYCVNYEKWQIQSGFEDRFWNNDKGYFTGKTETWGFLDPDYTHDPGQAGRGVAPADFDNDGEQEILVTNYRLCRNFLWDRQDSLFIDVAPLNGVQGILKKGYYGHSIGADWGDFDNDGDLDLFIANLAHPRYIDISDISQLLRNDGLKERVVEGDTIRYWQFTDITKQAGITFDELHSDPLWFDADNDGYLDLFITSVYENDRSYLYHNNGNGTFTDITWLSGTRVYNGWGNACADFDHDSKLDLVVGSGNGTKVFRNNTSTQNQSMTFKPVWQKESHVKFISDPKEFNQFPNSPAYGARVKLVLKTPQGKTITLMRELSSAKGTTSQNDQVLHFGLGKNKLIETLFYQPGSTQPESE